jgi:hypothetical protein
MIFIIHSFYVLFFEVLFFSFYKSGIILRVICRDNEEKHIYTNFMSLSESKMFQEGEKKS